MPRTNWRYFITCLFLSALSFGSIIFIRDFELKKNQEQEPYFISPLVTASQKLEVRNDSNAKGHYLARRNGGRHHKGIDFLVEEGKPILATRSGRVSRAEHGRGYGLYIEILHQDGFSTRYAHLSALSVQKGDWVPSGYIIGLSGRTGNADDSNIKPHLHYEIRNQDKPLNPERGLMSPNLKIINNK